MDLRNIKKPQKFTMKQIIIVRKDIKMGKGKLAAQAAHASGWAMLEAQKNHREWFEQWLAEGFPKVVLKAQNLEELQNAYKEATEKGLPAAIIADFGLTQLEEGTVTAVAIGPAPIEKVDEIGKKYKLL